MTTTCQTDKVLGIAGDAQRRHVLANSVVTPELRKAMQDQGKQISEALDLRVRVREVIPPQLEALMREQNQRIAKMLNSVGMRKALAGIDFSLSQSWAEQVATDTAVEGSAEAAGGIRRLAEDRDAIFTCLQRIGFAIEGLAYVPRFPIPPFVGYRIFLLAVLGEVADEKLNERAVDD